MTRYGWVVIYVASLLAIARMSSCATNPACRAQSLQQQSAPKTKHVGATYYYTAEEAYLDIKLDGSRLAVVYLPTTWKPKKDQVPWQSPWYKSSDLKHAEVKLTNAEVDLFVKLVKSSGFLKLKSHSGAPDNVRYYATTISVEFNGRTKKVEYRSAEEPLREPKPFAKVEDWLRKTAAARFKHFPPAK